MVAQGKGLAGSGAVSVQKLFDRKDRKEIPQRSRRNKWKQAA
jgi:hypothetical protein